MSLKFFAAFFAWIPAYAGTTAQPQPLKSGIEFQSVDVQRLQADDFGNPGMLWVTRGEALWKDKCASCHQDAAVSMRGVATRYPKHDAALGRVVNLDERIRACAARNPAPVALALESEPLLALSTYVSRQSRGLPISVATDGPAAAVLARGRDIYFQRQGQLNVACTQCHDASWGRTLLAEKLSQGHPADWPAYRLEWQTLGSLQRRLRACYFGVRAELPNFGAPDLVALELYLADRARGLAISPPGVRK
ncbi:MAG TPA: sulfur oxidation c-type cytochrome SoxA [Usitatibacter sp.]|nr:sulfur oxidation c-type cytochrome SoxA [Usitatibacter sp.]